MKRHTLMVLGFLLLAVVPLTADEIGLKNAKVTFRVVDDTGNPVAGAHINASDVWSAKGYQGLTDTNGSFSCYWRKIYSPISGVFSKKGYYNTQGNVWSGTQWGDVPTDTLTVTLKRIVNPVPMVKREVRLLFPVLGEPVGFDCEVGDWVAPHGAGVRADIWITGEMEWRTHDDFVLRSTLVTSNRWDGFIAFPVIRMDGQDIVRSHFQPPQQASTEAPYLTSIQAFRLSVGRGWEDSYDKNVDHYFRLRSKKDDQGKIVSAHVGWFDKGIRMTYNSDNRVVNEGNHLRISFAYYYNPDPTSRSLEPKEIADRQ